MKTKLLFLLICVTPLFVSAQDRNDLDMQPAIEVVGTGEMEIMPDEIYISFTLRERFDGRTKKTMDKQENGMKKELMKIGVDLNDLQLADASSDYIKVKWAKKDIISSKDYLLKVSNTSMLGNVFELFDRIDVYNAQISKTDHSKIEQYKKEVKIMAIQQAKEKAGYLLNAIGYEVGTPLLVQERENFNDYAPNRMLAMKSEVFTMDDIQQEQQLPEISFQKIKLKYTVFARFAIM